MLCVFLLLQHCEPAVRVDGPVQCVSHPCVRYQAVVAHCVFAIVLHKPPELVKKTLFWPAPLTATSNVVKSLTLKLTVISPGHNAQLLL